MASITHVLDHLGDTILKLTTPDLGAADGKSYDQWGSPKTPESDDSQPQAEHDASEVVYEVRFKVSSRHLCLASPVFKAMFEGPWKESNGTSLEPSEILASDFNAEAFHILLIMMHLQPEKIPETMKLRTMRDVALIADYYDCMKILHLYGHRCHWDDEESLLLKDRDLERWAESKRAEILFVAWAFQLDLFSKITYLIMRFSDNHLETDLPLPVLLLDALEEERMNVIHFFAREIDRILNNFLNKTVCSKRCDITSFEKILEDLKADGYDESKEDPYHETSPLRLYEILHHDFPFWYEELGAAHYMCPKFAAHENVVNPTSVPQSLAEFRLTKDGDWAVHRIDQAWDARPW